MNEEINEITTCEDLPTEVDVTVEIEEERSPVGKAIVGGTLAFTACYLLVNKAVPAIKKCWKKWRNSKEETPEVEQVKVVDSE